MNSSFIFSARVVAAVLALAGLTLLSASTSYAQTVGIVVDEDYGDSYKATATITNNTTASINGWLVELVFGGPMRSLWRGINQPGEGDLAQFKYAISNETYNGSLDPGESTYFSFIIDPDNDIGAPTTGIIGLPPRSSHP